MNKSNVRIRTQIIIIFLAIFMTVSGILVIAFPLSYDYIKHNYDVLFMEIMIKETDGQLRNQMNWYDIRLKTIINQIFQKQQIIRQLYIFVDTQDNKLQVPDPIYCPDFITKQNSLSLCCILIHGYNNETYFHLKSELQKEFKLTSLFNQIIMIFDPSQFIAAGIAFTFNTSYPSLSSWPALNFSKTYNPHNRSWFINHLNQMSNGHPYQYSNPFTTIFGSQTIAISSNILNKNGKFEGIVFDLLDFVNFKSHFSEQYILVNQNGQIILGRFQYPSNTFYFINDTNITGYTQKDWISIQNQAKFNNSENQSTCSHQYSTEFLCLNNSIYQYEGLILSKYLQNPPYPPYVMIIFKDITEVRRQINDAFAKIYYIFFRSMMISLQSFIMISLVSILIFIIISIIIIRPLEQLIIYLKKSLKNKKSQDYKSIICSKKFNLNNQLIKKKKQSNNVIDQIIGTYLSILRNIKDQQLKKIRKYQISNKKTQIKKVYKI